MPQSSKDKVIVAHIDRQAAKKAQQFRRGVQDALSNKSYCLKGYVWQQEAYNRGYMHGRYLRSQKLRAQVL